eukprot:3542766-Amphidinium_carterae.1
MPAEQGTPHPPQFVPMPPPEGVRIVNSLCTPELKLTVDMELILQTLLQAHLMDHPHFHEPHEFYFCNREQFETYPSLRVFSELLHQWNVADHLGFNALVALRYPLRS